MRKESKTKCNVLVEVVKGRMLLSQVAAEAFCFYQAMEEFI